jgi:predicted ATP-dependent protease
VPDSVKRALKIHLVETADEVLELALVAKGTRRSARARGRSTTKGRRRLTGARRRR